MNTPIEEIEKNKGYWYVATPYSKWIHGLEDANMVAQKLTARLLEKFVPCYSPISHTHGIATYVTQVDKRDHKFWLDADKPLFDAAYGLLIADLPGWRDSLGVALEIKWCKEARKPYWLLDPKDLSFRRVSV